MRTNPSTSFPRKRESSGTRLRDEDSYAPQTWRNWIPAFAGMTLRVSIWLYRHSLSLFLGRQCRFLPTCSEYADQAIQLHGPAKGSVLAFRRLCKCHPWGEHGFDPVPLPPHP